MNKSIVIGLFVSTFLAVGCSSTDSGPHPGGTSTNEKSSATASEVPGVTDDGVLKDQTEQQKWSPEFHANGVSFNASADTLEAIGVARWDFVVDGDKMAYQGTDTKGQRVGAIGAKTVVDGQSRTTTSVFKDVAGNNSTGVIVANETGVVEDTMPQMSDLAKAWFGAAEKDTKEFQAVVQRPYGPVGCGVSWLTRGSQWLNLGICVGVTTCSMAAEEYADDVTADARAERCEDAREDSPPLLLSGSLLAWLW